MSPSYLRCRVCLTYHFFFKKPGPINSVGLSDLAITCKMANDYLQLAANSEVGEISWEKVGFLGFVPISPTTHIATRHLPRRTPRYPPPTLTYLLHLLTITPALQEKARRPTVRAPLYNKALLLSFIVYIFCTEYAPIQCGKKIFCN